MYAARAERDACEKELEHVHKVAKQAELRARREREQAAEAAADHGKGGMGGKGGKCGVPPEVCAPKELVCIDCCVIIDYCRCSLGF